MATPELKESEDFLDPALLIPVKGKVYRVEPVSAETVVIMQKARDAARKAEEEGKSVEEISKVEVEGVDEDETRETMERRMLGATYDELLADGVGDVVRFRIIQIVTAWTFYGFESAKAYLATGGKAVTLPNRAERRTATRTRTAAANTKTASRTTMTTRKATPSKAKADSGQKSSSTGTPSKPTSKTSE